MAQPSKRRPRAPIYKSLTFDTLTEYGANTYQADKFVKALGYSLSSVAALIRYLNGGKQTTLSDGLDLIYGQISMARCVFRVFGTTDAISMYKHETGEGWSDPRIKTLSRLQHVANIWYHPFELLAVASTAAPKLVKVDPNWMWASSDWGWTLFCLLDTYMNIRKLRELARREKDILAKAEAEAEADGGPERVERRKRSLAVLAHLRWSVKMQQLRMVFYLPNAVHWCFYKPPLPKGVVAVLGLAEAIVGLCQSWPKEPVEEQL
ncbi:unnamed protein product [Chrysoparadoxa australica]